MIANPARLTRISALAGIFAAVTAISGCGGGSGAAPLSIATKSLSDGTVGAAYNQTVQSSGGTAPLSWTLSTGSLPAGLSLGNGTGSSVTISGTPSAAQNAASFTIKVTDSKDQTATQAFSVNIQNPAGPIISTSPAPPPATSTVPYAFTFTATGGLAPLVWSETGALPSGLTFSAGGTVTGKPTGTGSFPINITVTDSLQQTNTIPVQITVGDSGVSLSRLNGHYAFLFQGHRPQLGLPFDAVASFVADGAGGINNGHIDTNAAGGVPGSDITFTGTYSFDTTDQGQMEIKNTAAGLDMVFRMVALGPEGGPATTVRLAEFDTVGGGSALMRLQDTTQFKNAGISGDYILGLAGSLADGQRAVAAGRFSTNGSGQGSNEKMDVNVAGGLESNSDFTLNYAIPSGYNSGRGTATVDASLGGAPVTLHFAVYVVSASEAFLISSDTASASLPIFSGATARQTGSPFTNMSMKGTFVYALTGVFTSGANMGLQDANVGLMTTDGTGGFTLSGDENSAGTITAPQFSGTYSVDENGRVLITGSADPLVLYLSGDVGFMVEGDANASSGTFQRQTDDSALKSTLDGAPPLFSALQGSASAWNFTSITALSGGLFFGSWDVGIAYYYPQTGIIVNGTYTIAANGRGLFNPGDPYQEVFYVVGKNTFVVINSIGTIDNNPGLEIGACQQTATAGFGNCP
jgi:Putative Ig domain